MTQGPSREWFRRAHGKNRGRLIRHSVSFKNLRRGLPRRRFFAEMPVSCRMLGRGEARIPILTVQPSKDFEFAAVIITRL